MLFVYRRFKYFPLIITALISPLTGFGEWHNLSKLDVQNKITTCLQLHAIYNHLSEELVKRTMSNFYLHLDPEGLCLHASMKETWSSPSHDTLQNVKSAMERGDYALFYDLARYAQKTYKGSQISFSKKMLPNVQKSLKHDHDIQNMAYGCLLKAFTSSLDSHSQYLTQDEIEKFLSNMQQETVGIGVLIEKHPMGAKIIEIVDSGPAHKSECISIGDIITKINTNKIEDKSMDDIVTMLKGEENSYVTICVKRDSTEKEIRLSREKVCLEKRRLEIFKHPFGNDVIAICALHCFYGCNERTCSTDLSQAIKSLKTELGPKLKAIVLDLRHNLGGLLRQGVEVTNLFINAGVVVSIKNSKGEIQTFRHFGEHTVWNGPLFVLISKTSASCAEIVAQALQDYGRAVIVGDKRSFGKGTFQTFTSACDLNSIQSTTGDIKLTRGIYYTVSGRSPQNTGVESDIVIPSITDAMQIGESFSKFPLKNDSIRNLYEDNLEDVPIDIRSKLLSTYKTKQQKYNKIFSLNMEMLRKNSHMRILEDSSYQHFIKNINVEAATPYMACIDLQMNEALNVVKDFMYANQ